jgi:hypothetical protein
VKAFTIPTGTRIRCKEKGWELPKRCEVCRKLFRHKPFRTEREMDLLGGVVFRTYNSVGQLIGESRDETGLLGDKKRVHRSSRSGKAVATTRDEVGILGDRYRETSGPDGTTKSRSRERTGLLGDKYTESTGGTSQTRHITRTVVSWVGRKLRKTE